MKKQVKQNPLDRWRFNKENTFENYKAKGDMAHAYVCDDGFIHFCRDICGFRDLTDDFHGVICAVTINNPQLINKTVNESGVVDAFLDRKQIIRSRKRLALAFRGSFKSSIFSQAYPAWLIAREFVLYGCCNIRIGLQSEEMELAEGNVKTVKLIVESDKFKQYFGDHEPTAKTRGKGKWSEKAFTSALRTETLREATCSPISIEAEKTGRHFDVIVSDDFQALRGSFTREQLAKAWHHLRLNASLLNRPGIGWYSEKEGDHVWYSENLIGGTRWHHDDIYSKIKQENEKKEARFSILELPIWDSVQRPLFPEIFSSEEAAEIRLEQGAAIFAGQYLLQPMADEHRIFSQDFIRYYDEHKYKQKYDDMFRVIGVDVSWSEDDQGQSAAEQARFDISVVETWSVDAGWNFYLTDCWAKKGATKLVIVEEFFRQYFDHGAHAVGMDTYDKKYLWDVIRQVEFDQKRACHIVWHPRPAKRYGKQDQITGALRGLFSQGKVLLFRGLVDFEAEILDYPQGKFNYLDAMVQAVKVSAPARRQKDITPKSLFQAHFDSLKTKNPKDLYGRPLTRKHHRRTSRRARHKQVKVSNDS